MKRTLLLFLSASVAYLGFSSYALGPSGTTAGVQTAKNGCGGSGCHGAMGSNANMTLMLVESGQSAPVSDGKYKPGADYKIAFTQLTPGAAKFGYILLVTDGLNTQAGVLSNISSAPQYKVTTKGAFMVAEQPAPQNPIAGGTGAAVDWTAPAKGKGAVTFYVAVNSCNGNGNADGGDTWALKSLTLQEGWPVSVGGVDASIAVSAYPNPAANTLNVDIKNATSTGHQYSIYGLNGAIATTGQLNNHINSIDISALQSGVHFLKIVNGSEQKVISFNKL